MVSQYLEFLGLLIKIQELFILFPFLIVKTCKSNSFFFFPFLELLPYFVFFFSFLEKGSFSYDGGPILNYRTCRRQVLRNRQRKPSVIATTTAKHLNVKCPEHSKGRMEG